MAANFPPEILLLIADHLAWPKDKLRLLRVCRTWYDLLLPKAYEKVGLRGKTDIYLFARTIQSNPSISQAVRSFSVEWRSNPYTSGPSMNRDAQPCQEILNRASPSSEHRAKWEEDLVKGCPDAWLGIIAPYLESVTNIYIVYGGCSEYFFHMVSLAATKDAPFDSQSGLQKVEEFILRKDYDDNKADSYSAGELQPFVHLPAMRKMSFHKMGEEKRRSHWAFPKPAPGTANVKELEFKESNGTYGFSDIITSCAGLESLTYHHEDYVQWAGQAWDFHPYEFYKSLSTQKHSLQVLHLHNNGKYNYMGNVDDDEDFDPQYKRFGSLAEFTQLRDLRIPLKTLLQYGMTKTPGVSLENVLPSSLEHLTLVHYGEEYFGAISGGLTVMALERDRFPNLKRVEVKPVIMLRGPRIPRQNNFIVPQWYHDQFASIKVLFEERGIEFEIMKDDPRGFFGNQFEPFPEKMRSTLDEIFFM